MLIGRGVRGNAAWDLQQQIYASDREASAQYGGSVDIDDANNTCIVGAPLKGTSPTEYGAAYVYTRSGSTWTQQQKLTSSSPDNGSYFGYSVSVDGDYCIVGVPHYGATDTGRVEIFYRSGGTWTLQQAINGATGTYANFGGSVSISGNTVAIGADDAEVGGVDQGKVYIYTRSGTVWSLQQTIQSSDIQANDNFGQQVQLDGDNLIVGAPGEDGSGSDRGAAYVFTRSGGTWTQQQKLTASSPTNSYYFGSAVSIDGDTAAIYEMGSSPGSTTPGSVYVFTRSGSTWTQQQQITGPTPVDSNRRFGHSVSVNGTTVVIGSIDQDNSTTTDVGKVFVYEELAGTWYLSRTIASPSPQTYNEFGFQVMYDGSSLIIGERYGDPVITNAGCAYIYTI